MREQYKRANDHIRVPEDLKERTVRGGEHAPRRSVWPAAVVAAMILAVACAAILWPRGNVNTADEPGVPVRPGGEQSATPEGQPARVAPLSFAPDYTARYGGETLDDGYLAAIRTFAASAGQELLDGDKTTAYSPTTLYTALSMVAELADGSSREALLNALGAEGVEALRQYSGDLWRYLCANPDTREPGKITMANSIWLNDRYSFNVDTMRELVDYYYVSGCVGDMVNSIPQMVSKWVRDQTNGLLDCQIEPKEDTMAVLLSAIYFYDQWAEQFDKYEVRSGAFRTGDASAQETVTVHIGEEDGIENPGTRYIPCMYMERTERGRDYYKGKGVTAAVQYFENGGKMLFILPDEGNSPVGVLNDTALLAALLNWEKLDREKGTVDWLIPQFALSDTLDLVDGLSALGLGELFDSDNNALPLLSGDGTPAYISEARQGTAISINEVGCEAVSYVEISLKECASDPGEEVVMMYLTRPFVFAILSDNDVPLFLGVVNDPNG